MIDAVDERDSPSDVWGTRLPRSEPPSFTEAMAKAGCLAEFTRPELRPLVGDPSPATSGAPSLRPDAAEPTEATGDAPGTGDEPPGAASNWPEGMTEAEAEAFKRDGADWWNVPWPEPGCVEPEPEPEDR